MCLCFFFFSSRRRHTRCALVTGVQTCALPIYAGLEDDVDWHWKRIVAGAVLTTLLGVGAELAAPENRQDGNRIAIAGRDSAQATGRASCRERVCQYV